MAVHRANEAANGGSGRPAPVLGTASGEASDDERDTPTIPVRATKDSGVVSDRESAECIDEAAIDEDAIIELPHSRRVVQQPIDDVMIELPGDGQVGVHLPPHRLLTFDDDVIGLPGEQGSEHGHHEIPPPPPDERWADADYDPEMDDVDLHDMIIYPSTHD